MGGRTVFSDEAMEDALLKLHRTMGVTEFITRHKCTEGQLAHLTSTLRRSGAKIPRQVRAIKNGLPQKIANLRARHPGLFEEMVNKNLPKNMQPKE